MFWVIFDTSTKRDYYQDVHNLLAMPPGSILRYDYRSNHISDAALREAETGDLRVTDVLVAYAQSKNFKKGDADPSDSIAYEHGLWIGTRLAKLRSLHFKVNRYYFDLELLGYPFGNEQSMPTIMKQLALAQETPFEKWVALSGLDQDFQFLTTGTPSENWTSIINSIGNFPSQFAGDSFWRIAKITRGKQRSSIQPQIEDQTEDIDGQPVKTGVRATFQVFELDQLALQVECRLPEADEESRGKEASGPGRLVTFSAATGGPLTEFNDKSLPLRRYAMDWVGGDVQSTDRLDAQVAEIAMRTGPVTDGYPAGAGFALHFSVTKDPSRRFLALLLALLAVILLGVAAVIAKDQPGWAIASGAIGAVLGAIAGLMWTGRLKLPLGK